MGFIRKWSWILAVWLAWSGWGTAQEVDERQAVSVVKIPVQVTKGGAPVRGLTAANFTVFDGGEAQPLHSFEVIDLDDLSDDVLGSMEPWRQRHFLYFFDLYFSSPPYLRKAKEAAAKLLYEGMGIDDKVAVVAFTPNQGVVMLTGFSYDEVQIEAALDAVNWFTDPRNQRDLTRVHNNESEAAARQDSRWYEERFYVGPRDQVGLKLETRLEHARDKLRIRLVGDHEAARAKELLDQLAHMKRVGAPRPNSNAVLSLTNDLALLAHALKNIEGGKYVVFFSEGYPNALARSEPYAEMIQVQVEKMLEIFRLSGWIFHTIDVRGLRHLGASPSQDSLNLFANDTGGYFYRNRNNLDKVMTQLMENTSLTYLLAIQPANLIADGSYHPLRVVLKNAPSGAKIQYSRPGYFAPLPPSP